VALIVRGVTRCGICGRVINDGDDVVAFSPFLWDVDDPLYVFNDAAFHRDHFDAHPLAPQALARHREMLERTAPAQRICPVCNQRITEPDDYIGTGHLSPDPSDPLYAFNYVHLHRSHLKAWRDLDRLIDLLEARASSGSGNGGGPTQLLPILRGARAEREARSQAD
jgi:hypothetical protein